MRAVVQRVSGASVVVGGETLAAIGRGYVVLVGVCGDDDADDVEWLADKIVRLRIFDDERGVMNLSIGDVGGDILVVSQFTLYASYRKNNRPSWCRAAPHDISVPLYEALCERLSALMGKPVGRGRFGAYMQVRLTNDGPVTICIDTKNRE